MEYTRLYLKSWAYNAACILHELEKLVLEKGGAIVSTWDRKRKLCCISNRSLSAAVKKQENFVCALKRTDSSSYEEQLAELKKLQQIDNTPRVLYYGDWYYISFTMGGVYYYYQLDDNPFFDFLYSKSRIVNGRVLRNRCCAADSKEWLDDCYFSFMCTDEERRKAAAYILKMLVCAAVSEIDYRYTETGAWADKVYVLAQGNCS